VKQGLGAGATPQCAATAAASQEMPPAKNSTDDGRGEGRWRMTFTPPRRTEVEGRPGAVGDSVDGGSGALAHLWVDRRRGWGWTLARLSPCGLWAVFGGVDKRLFVRFISHIFLTNK